MVDPINRRKLLGTLTAGAGIGLAGCLGDDDDDDDDAVADDTDDADDADDDDEPVEHGERVPDLQFETLGGLGGESENLEAATIAMQRQIEDAWGLDVEVRAKDAFTMWTELYEDSGREQHMHIDWTPSEPTQIDPSSIVDQYTIDRAGNNGLNNTGNWANCDFTMKFIEQRAAPPEERQEAANEMLREWSEDIHTINLISEIEADLYRKDQLEVPDAGIWGVHSSNAEFYRNIETVGDVDEIRLAVSPTLVRSPNYMENIMILSLSQAFFSTLVTFDTQGEYQPNLATDWEIDGNEVFTYELREDAAFHNGDPVTAEDVQFTYQHVEEFVTEYEEGRPMNFESIEVIDDHTVEFTLEDPIAEFHTMYLPMFGVVHKGLWEADGADEDPANLSDEAALVGSGPWEVDTYERESLIAGEPFEDHWMEPNAGLVFQAFREGETAQRAVEAGEINIGGATSSDEAYRLAEEDPDTFGVIEADWITDRWILPQHHIAPTKFVEFREAISRVVDRHLAGELIAGGHHEPHLYSSPYSESHPFYPENPDEVLRQIADSPEQDVEGSRQVLEDAGWTWDDDGNLRYPPDADLEPLWPEGDEPRDYPDQFPCVEDL